MKTRLRRWGTLEFTILLFKRKPQNAAFLSLEPADGMVKITLKQLWKRFNVFYMASDLCLNVWSCSREHVHRATTSTGKPVSILCGIAKNCRLFWYWICSMLVVQTVAWFLYWLAIKSVTIFIKCFFPILLCFILSCLDISESKPSVWNLLFVKF